MTKPNSNSSAPKKNGAKSGYPKSSGVKSSGAKSGYPKGGAPKSGAKSQPSKGDFPKKARHNTDPKPANKPDSRPDFLKKIDAATPKIKRKNATAPNATEEKVRIPRANQDFRALPELEFEENENVIAPIESVTSEIDTAESATAEAESADRVLATPLDATIAAEESRKDEIAVSATKADSAKADFAKSDSAKSDSAQNDSVKVDTKKSAVSTAKKAPEASRDVAKIAPEISEESAPLPLFSDLELSEPVARAIAEMGFESPTPIQAQAVPLLMQGHDLIGQAQTGTGKTAAFALPLIHKIDAKRPEVQALVLAPTRELAIQVANGIYELAKHTGLRVVPIYGGQPIDRQFRALKNGAHIVVGTPGRVQDHMRRGSLTLSKVTFCALDEADEMLALGFVEDITMILSELPEERQLAFFSATMPPRIVSLMRKFLREPKLVSIENKKRTLDTTNQAYYEVAPGQKFESLVRVLDMETPGPTIVFCRTRQETNDLAEALRMRGYSADALHGDMSQSERERVLRRFRDEQSDMLIATDVAARGLDIDSVTHVINYDIPWDVEQYIHRIGRTGRAGRSGDAITFVQGRERRQLKIIEQAIGSKIKPVRLPTAADIAARRRDLFKESLRQTLESGDFDGYLTTVEELSESFDATEIAAAALQMLWKKQHSDATEMADEMAADGEQPEAGMVRLFVGLGRQDNLRPGDLVGAIAHEAGLSGREIGAIDILDRSAFVEVPAHSVETVINALSRTKLRGKKVSIQVARPHDSER